MPFLYNHDQIIPTTDNSSALASHPDVQPPKPHPTTFFLVDFIRTTRAQLRNINLQKLSEGDKKEQQILRDIVGRNWFANMILNDKAGALSLVTPGDGSNSIQIGPEIKEKAKALQDFWGL